MDKTNTSHPDPEQAAQAAAIAYALAHPVRLQILQLLDESEAYVMHLTNMLGRPQANISQHLAVLREAGLVIAEREGMTVLYRLRSARVRELIGLLSDLAQYASAEGTSPRGRGRRGRRHGRRQGRCNCPRCQ